MITLKAGSEYDASPQRKRNAEIEIESIPAFSVALRLRRGLASYSEPGLMNNGLHAFSCSVYEGGTFCLNLHVLLLCYYQVQSSLSADDWNILFGSSDWSYSVATPGAGSLDHLTTAAMDCGQGDRLHGVSSIPGC